MALLLRTRTFPLIRPRLSLLALASASTIAVAGLACLLLSPLLGPSAFDSLWAVEPLGYIGAVLLIVGLAVTALGLGVLAKKQACSGSIRAGCQEKDRRGAERSLAAGHDELFSTSSTTTSAGLSAGSRADSAS